MNNFTITLQSVKQVNIFEKYDFICGYYVGSSKFSLRPTHDFSISEIIELRGITKRKIFVNVNKLIHNEDINVLEEYLIELSKIGIDHVIFSDFSVYELVMKNNLDISLVYSTETTITNSKFTDFAKVFNMNGVELAKELTLEEVKEIANKKHSTISINIHGHLYMYQSVRKLLTNYENVSSIDLKEKTYYLFDEERNKYYPIVENEQGTHVLASNDITLLHHLDKVKEIDIDYLKIDTFAYFEKDIIFILELFKKAIQMLNDNEYKENKSNLLKELKHNISHKNFDTGFYFKKTVYK